MTLTEADIFNLDSPLPEILDRSTAERYADCPFSARARRDTPSFMRDVGDEVHRIASEVMFARHEFNQHSLDLRQLMQDLAEKSRPDVQPDVVNVVRRGGWKFIQRLCESGLSSRHPDDLMRFDGGKGDRSGQLAADIEVSGVTVRLTAELDLLMATPSPNELDLDDYKSGRTWWTPSMVRTAFQWQWYSWLIFRNYPDVNRVNVRVHIFREGVITEPVYFDRADMMTIQKRIVSAVQVWLENRERPLAEVPAWPDIEKCGRCDCVARCPHAERELVSTAINPVGALQQFVALDAKWTRARNALAAHVRRTGQNIVDGANVFGTGEPKSARQASVSLYETKGD